MNVSHPMGILHSFSVKNIFYDKMYFRLFYFDVAIYLYCSFLYREWENGNYGLKKFEMHLQFQM